MPSVKPLPTQGIKQASKGLAQDKNQYKDKPRSKSPSSLAPSTKDTKKDTAAASSKALWRAVQSDVLSHWVDRNLGPEQVYRKGVHGNERATEIGEQMLGYTPTERYTGDKLTSRVHKDWKDGYKTDGSNGSSVRVAFKDDLIPDYKSVGLTAGEMAWKKLEGTDEALGGWKGGKGGHGGATAMQVRLKRRELETAESTLQRLNLLDRPGVKTLKYGTVTVPTADGVLEDWKLVSKYGTKANQSKKIKEMSDDDSTKEAWLEEATKFEEQGLKTSAEMMSEYDSFQRHYSHHGATRFGEGEQFALDYINAMESGHKAIWTAQERERMGDLLNMKQAARRTKRQLDRYDAEKTYTGGRMSGLAMYTTFHPMSMEKAMEEGNILTEDEEEEFRNDRWSKVGMNGYGRPVQVVNLAEFKARFPLLEKYRSMEQCEAEVEEDSTYGETILSERCLEVDKLRQEQYPISVMLTEAEMEDHRKRFGKLHTQLGGNKMEGCVDPNCDKPHCERHGQYRAGGGKHSWGADELWTWHDEHPDFKAHDGTEMLTTKPNGSKAFEARPGKEEIMSIRRKNYLKSQGTWVDEDDDADTVVGSDDDEDTKIMSKKQKRAAEKAARKARSTESAKSNSRSSSPSRSSRSDKETAKSNSKWTDDNPVSEKAAAKAAAAKMMEKRKQQSYLSTSDTSTRASSRSGMDKTSKGAKSSKSTSTAGDAPTTKKGRSAGPTRTETDKTTSIATPRTAKSTKASTFATKQSSAGGSTLEKMLTKLGVTREQMTSMIRDYLTTDEDATTSGGMSSSPLTAGQPSMIAV